LAFFFFFFLATVADDFLAFFLLFFETAELTTCVIFPGPGASAEEGRRMAFLVTLAGATLAVKGLGVIAAEPAEDPELPVALVATAEKVYATPLVRPVIVQEPAAPVTVHVFPPGEAVTRYEDGVSPGPGPTVTVADPSPPTAVGAGGVPGGELARAGLTALEAPDEPDVPPALVAVVVNVYGVPLARPVIVHEPDAPVTVHVLPPGLAVTV
jgi:hypothetical protein